MIETLEFDLSGADNVLKPLKNFDKKLFRQRMKCIAQQT